MAAGDDGRTRRFEAVALPHLSAAYNLARWICRNEADAADVVQEAVMRALQYFDGYRAAMHAPGCCRSCAIRRTAGSGGTGPPGRCR